MEKAIHDPEGFFDDLRLLPVIEAVVTMIEHAVTTGETEIPAIKVKVAGKRVTLGPCPVKLG